jgi:hypothetical protein
MSFLFITPKVTPSNKAVKNYHKTRGKKNWKRMQARGHKLELKATRRRELQVINGRLDTHEVKVTPRREKDFTSRAWRLGGV